MLTLPPKFKQALGNGTRTSLYPLVRIYKGVQIDDPLDSATEVINLSIKETNIGGEAYNPLLLNSPSISSKADIINNKYTISSVSLSISNAPYNGKIFSDDIPSLLNAVVQVYYAANGLDTLDDCLLVYTGTIRRYSQSAETLSLTLEDLTEQKLKTKIPATLIEDENNFTEDSIGQPYPMVYGYVDKSPLINDNNNNFIVEKPENSIAGQWLSGSEIDYGNTIIDTGHPLVDNFYLRKNSYLYAYDNGFLPIFEKGVKNWGSRYYEQTDTDKTIYIFTNAENQESAKITLQDSFVNEQYDDVEKVGIGSLGIPTRVYRPITNVSFFAYNNPEAQFSERDINSFLGYVTNDGTMNDLDFSVNLGQNTSLTNTIYENHYNNNTELNYWRPTKLNQNLEGEKEVFDDIDTRWQQVNNNGKFPVSIIQNNTTNSGLNIFSINGAGDGGGAFARLQFTNNVGDFPCVSKIFYDIQYFAASNQLISQNASLTNPQNSIFYFDRNLANRLPNVDETSINDWYYEGSSYWYTDLNEETYHTPCKVPNLNHNFTVDDLEDNVALTRWRLTNPEVEGILNFGDTEFGNIINGFGSTNSFDSIQWGMPKISSHSLTDTNSTVANLREFYFIQDVLVLDYTNKNFYGSIKGRIDNNENVITKPHNILQDILDKELGYEKQIILPDETIQDDWINSFTLQEQKEAKNIIENLFKSSIYIPTFDSEGNFKFIDLKQNIEDYEQFEVIDNLDIIKYSFGLTKLEDVKNQINVKYKKNYGSGDFSKATTYGIEDNNGNFVETLDELTQQLDIDDMVYDIAYYGMKDEDAKLEVETEYIRDKDTARKLQRRLLMWYANQHLTMKLDLPPSYMHLEAGDYLRFDELIGGKLAFGFDYTQEFVKNGQLIYPVFFVTKVAKSLSKVSLELVQVHRGDFGKSDDNLNNYLIPNPYLNDAYQDIQDEEEYFTFSWYLDNNNLESGVISAITDTNLQTGIEYEVLLTGSSATFTYNGITIQEGVHQHIDATDLVNASIIETGSEYGDNVQITPKMFFHNIETDEEIVFLEFELTIKSDTYDYAQMKHFMQSITQPDVLVGDISGEGVINVLDVVQLVQIIVLAGDYEPLGDMNGDGLNNVLDVIILVNMIVGN